MPLPESSRVEKSDSQEVSKEYTKEDLPWNDLDENKNDMQENKDNSQENSEPDMQPISEDDELLDIFE